MVTIVAATLTVMGAISISGHRVFGSRRGLRRRVLDHLHQPSPLAFVESPQHRQQDVVVTFGVIDHRFGFVGGRTRVARTGPKPGHIGRNPLPDGNCFEARFLHHPGDSGANEHLDRAIVDRRPELGVQEIDDAS